MFRRCSILGLCPRRSWNYSQTRKTIRRLMCSLAHENLSCALHLQKCHSTCTQPIRHFSSFNRGIGLNVDKSECLMDEDIVVKVSKLTPSEKVTILATTEIDGNLFWSHGVFRANDSGVVDLSTDTPISGSYDEADPVGLIWSMVAAPWLPAHWRMFQARAIKPRIFTFSVFPESDDPSQYLKDSTKMFASVEHKRWYKSSDTRRIPVEHPRLQGTVFLPEGPGPFPGVIDMYGGLVAIVEGRAALLASKGFATLSLSYVNGKNLPQTMLDIELNYFEDAANWFASLPEVRSDGLGVLSLCLGGTMALWMAQTIPNVRAVVNINGMPYTHSNWTYNKIDIGCKTWIDIERFKKMEEGLSVRDMFVVHDKSFLKPWTHGAHLLTISGGDDLMTRMEYNVRLYEEFMPQDYRQKKTEFVVYPGAGHLIEVPHAPVCRVVEAANRIQQALHLQNPVHQHNNLLLSGGYPKEHAAAQRNAWQLSVDFLKKHLC